MKIELRGKKVFIEVKEEVSKEAYEQTESGIFLHNTEQEGSKRSNPSKIGTITNVGELCEKGYEVGDDVLFLGHQSTEIEFDGTHFHILDEEFVIGKVTR